MKTHLILAATGLFLLIFITVHSPLTAQGKKARAAAVLASEQLLSQAQAQNDSLHFDEAVVLARQAESLLLEVYEPGDKQLFKAYLVLGIGLMQVELEQAIVYKEKLEAMGPANDKSLQAGFHFFRGFIFQKKEQSEPAWTDYEAAYELYKTLPIAEQSYVVRMLSNQGVLKMNTGDFETAIVYYNRSEALALRQYAPDHTMLAFPVGNRGLAHIYNMSLAAAVKDLLHALQIREKSLPAHHIEITRNYLNLGLAYGYMWDYDTAVPLLRKSAIDFLAAKDTSGFAVAVGNIGLTFSSRNQYDSTAYYYNWALEMERDLYPKDDPRLLITVFNLGNTLTHARRYSESVAYLYEAWGTAQPDDPNRSSYASGIGFVHYKTGELDSAEYYYKKELKLLKASGIPELSPATTQALFSLANISFNRNDFEAAADWNQKGMESISYLKPGAYRKAFYSINLLLLLEQKARITAQIAKANPGDVYAVRQWQIACEDAFQGSLYFRETMQGPKSRQHLLEKGISSLSMGIEANRQLAILTGDDSYNERAFQLAEQSKSQSLLEAIKRSKARSFAGIPDSVLDQESALIQTIDKLEAYRYEGGMQGVLPSHPEMGTLMLQIDSLNTRLSTLKEEIAQTYPKYARALGKGNPPSMAKVQQSLLEPNQTLVEYVVGDSLIHIFLIQSGHTRLLSISKDFPLEETVENMTQSGIYGYLGRAESHSNAYKMACDIRYYQSARLLYEKLWKPVKQYLGESVIIVPDGVLGYIPFEALIPKDSKRPGAFNTYSYLLEGHVISYSYSSSLLQEMQALSAASLSEAPALIMAPFTASNVEKGDFRSTGANRTQALERLPNSENEARKIGSLLQSPFTLGSFASIDYFLTHAEEASIIHLSTHALADDQNGDFAFLAFASPDTNYSYTPLYSRRLYSLELHADLVYLSACETGTGQLKKGEGIISLSRAFAYAGAKSIITTLWKAEDKISSEIGQAFYQNWQVGKLDKRKALCTAKRGYLISKRGRDPEADHPFYWAGLIGIGDMNE